MDRTTDYHTCPRLYVTAEISHGQAISLGKEQSHYLQDVLRLKMGETVRLFNGIDGEWRGEISALSTGKSRAIQLVIREQLREQNSEPDLWLCCSPIKRSHFDFMIMKATELGVARIQPILTARTQVRDINKERLASIAIEAAEQSERLNIPTIADLMTLDKFLDQSLENRLPLICAEFGEAEPIFTALSRPQIKTAKKVAIITGPEGGFSIEEMKKLHELQGATALRLGPRILRADTAALAAISCWQSLYGDWK